MKQRRLTIAFIALTFLVAAPGLWKNLSSMIGTAQEVAQVKLWEMLLDFHAEGESEKSPTPARKASDAVMLLASSVRPENSNGSALSSRKDKRRERAASELLQKDFDKESTLSFHPELVAEIGEVEEPMVAALDALKRANLYAPPSKARAKHNPETIENSFFFNAEQPKEFEKRAEQVKKDREAGRSMQQKTRYLFDKETAAPFTVPAPSKSL